MKKRLLSALLALALVFVLLPTTALADTPPETDDNVKINGTPVTVGNDISLGDGNGTYSYDKSTRTLTLNNATITATGSNIGIDFCDTTNYVTYSVILTGENTVTSNKIAIETTPNTNLTFTGGGNLKAITNGYYQAIRVYGTLTIDNSTLIAESSADTATTVIWTLAMTGDNAKLEISNKRAANIVAGTAGPASKNIDWSNYQFTTGSYSGGVLTKSDPEVCSRETLNKYLGLSQKEKSQYIHIAKRTIPALQRTPDVLIAGEKAVVGQWTTITADSCSGSYYYNADKKELTLKDVNIASSSIINGIQFTKDGTYTINLVGTNTMSGFSTGISANSADQYVSNINITITGAGSLEVSTTSYAIAMNKGNLKFENTGEIKLTTSNPSKNRNVLSVSGNITITDMDKYSVTGITQTGNPNVTGDTVTLSKASHLKGYQNPDGTAICLKAITITPAAAKPSTISYNGKTLKQGETIKDGKGGTATVATKGNTITLNNFNGTAALSFEATLADSTLVLEGTNTLSSIVTTQKGLTISGSGSLTVGSIRVTNNDNISADLTITGGATVIAGTATSDAKAIDITGNLTVNSGATLTATNTSETKPTIDVTGNVTISGDPGTNAYTVSAHNSYNVQKDRVGNLSPSGVPSAIKIGGTLNISAGARVMAQTDSYGAGVMLGQNSTITVEDAFLSAQNSSCDFAAISFSGYMGDINVSGAKGEIVAENTHTNIGTKLAFKAINAFVYNRNTDFYLKMQSEGVIDEEIIAPGEYDASGGKKVTITRGDEVTPVVIAGTPLLNDTYYTITNGSTVVANGSESNYNAFYDSANKTLKLNNAQISHSFAYEDGGGKDGAIIFTKFENYFIELSGENTISSTNTYAINCHRPDRTLTIKNAAEAENAKLTLTSNWMVICSIGGLNIQSDVTMVNTKRADYLMYVNGTFSYTGYNAYASTEASGSPLEVYNPENYSTYKYLRVTKENLAPTTPTTYTVTITAGDNMKRESGALTQEVTKGAAITEVKFMAASGHYFPADYVSKMNLPAGLTAEIRENSWYLIISGTPTSDVTINLPAASVRPTITVSMPTPVAGYTPATASDITLTYSDINKSISKNLTISNVVWQSYVSNGDGSITPGNTLSSGDKFEAGKTYFVRITHEYVAGKYDIVPAAGITLDYTESDSTDMMLLFYTTGAPCNHEYTNDWHANGNTHWHECKLCRAHADEVAHTFGDWITDTPATDTTDGSKHRTCSVCQYKENATIPKTGTGEIVPPTPDNPGTIVIIRPAEEEKPAQQPNPSTGANDLVGLAVAAAVAAALGSAALLRKHD